MSTFADELFKSAQSLQAAGQNTAAQIFLTAATQENALNASAALLADAATVTQLQTVTNTVHAQTTRLAASLANAQKIVSIGTNILTVIGGASNPLSVLPTLNTVVAQLGS
jgi:hypothetical protein